MTGHDLSVRRIPVMSVEGPESGPVVILSACIHGDEIGGTVVVHELFRILKKYLLRGRIVAFPMLNPFGFENTSRRISLSNEDLNRSFPGNPRGTLAQRIAAITMQKITELSPALVLDLHNDWNKSIPYVVIDPVGSERNQEMLRHLAITSGLPAIVETDHIPGAFSCQLNLAGIPALTLELGESLIINEKNVISGVEAVIAMIGELGILQEGIAPASRSGGADSGDRRVLTYSSKPLCSTSGIIRFTKKPGDRVKKGERIARVYNAFGKLIETIHSVHNGIILGHNDYAVAFPGSPVMAFGVSEEER